MGGRWGSLPRRVGARSRGGRRLAGCRRRGRSGSVGFFSVIIGSQILGGLDLTARRRLVCDTWAWMDAPAPDVREEVPFRSPGV